MITTTITTTVTGRACTQPMDHGSYPRFKVKVTVTVTVTYVCTYLDLATTTTTTTTTGSTTTTTDDRLFIFAAERKIYLVSDTWNDIGT